MIYQLTVKAPRLLVENIAGLLRVRGAKQTDLAQWCRRSDVWISNVLSGKRNLTLRDLDRIADFFGLATYQLFQPGVSRMTERRSGVDRRRGRERRISHKEYAVRALADAIGRPMPIQAPVMEPLTDAETELIQRLRQKPDVGAAVSQLVGLVPTPKEDAPKIRKRRKTVAKNDKTSHTA